MQPILIEVPTLFEAMTVNCWLIKEPEPVLIDCGEKTDEVWEALEKGLKREGLTIGSLKKVVITHAHLDHMGIAKRIVEQSDAEIWVSEPVKPWAIDLKKMLDLRDEAMKAAFEEYMPQAPPFKFGYKELASFWDEIPAERVKTFPLDGTIEMGGETWEVIHTPGHCINQTAFFHRPSGQFFSGDSLLEIIPPPIIDMSIEKPYSRTNSMVQLLETYQKLLALPIKVVYPGHMKVIDNVEEVIQKQLKRINRRKEACYTFIEEGVDHFFGLRDKLYPHRKTPPTFLMILGLLDLLKAEGRIHIDSSKGKITALKRTMDI